MTGIVTFRGIAAPEGGGNSPRSTQTDGEWAMLRLGIYKKIDDGMQELTGVEIGFCELNRQDLS